MMKLKRQMEKEKEKRKNGEKKNMSASVWEINNDSAL
jgi:hypothetical protein